MLIVTNATLLNPGILDTSSLPKKFLGHVLVLPRGAGLGVWLRMVLEIQILRYLVTLLPFIAAPLMAPKLAVPVMQAPVLMLILIALVELKLLRLSKSARARSMTDDDAARRLDTLTFRARACLRAIAANHQMADGDLRLVIEQSELARVAPLTLVSVQIETPNPHLPPLDARDRAILTAGLFDADLTERDLLAVNHKADLYMRDIAQPARAVSAHARLAAYLEPKGATP
jgi:hypothetical protein